jgi:hypothetical protein
MYRRVKVGHYALDKVSTCQWEHLNYNDKSESHFIGSFQSIFSLNLQS